MKVKRCQAPFLLILLMVCLIFSCDYGLIIYGGTTTPPETGLIVHKYTSMSEGVTYILEIFQHAVAATARATNEPEIPNLYTPAAEDTYKLTIIYASGNTITNIGTIAVSSTTTTSATFALSNGENLFITISKEGHLTSISGTINNDSVRAPGTGPGLLAAPGPVTPQTAGTPPVVSDSDGSGGEGGGSGSGGGGSGGGSGGGGSSGGSGPGPGGGSSPGGGGASGGGGGGSSTVAVSGVSLNTSTLILTVGGSATLTATVVPSNATNQFVTWSSSNTPVAAVSNGAVTALSAGSATITVTTQDGGRTAACVVTVSESAAGVSIGVKEIEDGTPTISGTDIKISRTGSGGIPVTFLISVSTPDNYNNISWEIAGVGVYAGQTVTGNGSSFTLNAGDVKYNSLGGHSLILTATKGGLQYQKAILFTVVQ
jgi:uncharacterized protein YjdB